jgi:hypothetical protein
MRGHYKDKKSAEDFLNSMEEEIKNISDDIVVPVVSE